MAAELACSVSDSLESKSFNLRLQHSVTKNLPGDHCIETDVPFPSGAGAFRCTAKYWPNWKLSNCITISVVVTRTHRHIRHKVLAAHIDLPGKTGLPAPVDIMAGITRGAMHVLAAAGDVEGGTTLSVRRADVERYCVDDDGHFTALCTVAVSRSWPPPPLPAFPTLGRDISVVAPDLADVSFRVEGETFAAHRLVLAARSPVFKAALYGEMAESKASSVVEIEDMRAPTFRSMLDYMYHGSLPVAATAEMDDAAVKMEFQHLYVAADRYGLDTLKEMCEEVLCASVSVSTVLSNLVFAEERTCAKLKPRCLDFLAVGENFKEVAVTSEYFDMMMESPGLLAEVQNWFKRPRLS
ncbi:unnamed protein product [Urochloa decumbens]|uniref:BTB domain-containing protein n=1 Tax=Urochloa decumbens TaxID=240449 RepID=A0ABC9FTL2_9POAL